MTPFKKQHYFLLYKPYGVLSQFINNQNTRKNRKLLGELFDFPVGSMAVGRLDYQSEGLLLITTDGKFSQQIRSNKVEKEYFVQVDGTITDTAINHLQKGVIISIEGKKYRTKPAKVRRIETPDLPERTKKIRDARHGPTSWVSITIREGKFRQVRKMTAALGFPTLRLVRVRIGNYRIEDLKPGRNIANISPEDVQI